LAKQTVVDPNTVPSVVGVAAGVPPAPYKISLVLVQYPRPTAVVTHDATAQRIGATKKPFAAVGVRIEPVALMDIEFAGWQLLPA
jgi:hypothetical protein